MKHLKMVLALAAAIIAALMAFAGGASATSVTTTTGGAVATPTIHFVNEDKHVTFENPLSSISCNSTFEGNVNSHGSGAATEVGLSIFSLAPCTNSWHYTTITPGVLVFNWTSGHDGTVIWTGAKFDSTRFGVTCVYETNNTKLGTVIGGDPATLRLEASIPINTAESSGLCGAGNAKWEGDYAATAALYIAP